MKFCIFCGKALEEGQTCECQQNVQTETTQTETAQAEATPTQQVQPTLQPSQANEMVNGFLNALKAFIISPATGAKELVTNGNVIISIILLAAQAVLSGIVSLILCGFQLKMDAGDCIKYFVLAIVFSVVLSLVLFGVSLLVSVCMKGETSPQKVLNALALRSIAVVPFTLLAIPMAFLSSSVAIALVFVCEVLGLFYLYFGCKEAFGLDASKTSYLVVITAVVYLLIFALICKSVAEDFLQNIIYSAFR